MKSDSGNVLECPFARMLDPEVDEDAPLSFGGLSTTALLELEGPASDWVSTFLFLFFLRDLRLSAELDAPTDVDLEAEGVGLDDAMRADLGLAGRDAIVATRGGPVVAASWRIWIEMGAFPERQVYPRKWTFVWQELLNQTKLRPFRRLRCSR